MDVQQRIVDDVAVFRIAGEHTPRDLGTLRAHVRGALETGVRNVVVDLREMTQLGCTGLGELISVHGVVRRLGGHLTVVDRSRSHPRPAGRREFGVGLRHGRV